MKAVVAALSLLGLAGIGLAQWAEIGPAGGMIQALTADPSHPGTFYAASYDYPSTGVRIWKSTDGGSSWSTAGTAEGYSINQLLVDPSNSDYLYALNGDMYVLRSTNAGQTWQRHSLPGYSMDICAAGSAPGRLYVSGYNYSGGYYYAYVYTSSDYGVNWTGSQADTWSYSYAMTCCASPANPALVYASSSGGGVFRSTDFGSTWTPSGNGMPVPSYVYDLAISPSDPSVILAGLADVGLYRTTDAGENWELVSYPPRGMYVAFCPSLPGACYANYDSLYYSTDYGLTWVSRQPGPVTGGRGTGFIVRPDSAAVLLMGLSTGIYCSRDQGANWSASQQGLNVSHVLTLAVSGIGQPRVYAELMNVGVHASTDWGNSWTRCTDFLSCGNICGLGIVPGLDHDILYALEGSG
jgi:photosystem II stability/assembly factor-like uncharacterized protein